MKVRYTATAGRELSEAVDYLVEHAPAVAGDFVDSVEHALAELLRNPYSAQETEQQRPSSRAFDGNISHAFATAFSTRSMKTPTN